MDARTFFGLRPTDDPQRWRLPVVRALCSGTGALFGGAALGASIEIAEGATRRPCVWATAQFLEFARPSDVVDLGVEEVVRGHRSSQARVRGEVAGREIFTVLATLGRRDLPWDGTWAACPHVPGVDESPRRALPAHLVGTIGERLEVRLASAQQVEDLDGRGSDDGRSAIWVRLPPELEPSAAALAIVADYVPFGITQALGRRVSSNSLDNTLRMVRSHATEWVLADIRVQAVADGFGHGVVHLWTDDRTLLATASQSTVVRELRPPPEREPPIEARGGASAPESSR